MTSRNRLTLKNYFREGHLPTEEHFVDLIDSMLNMTDEGFRKGLEHGEEIYVPMGHNALVSFFRSESPQVPVWTVQFSDNRDQLLFCRRMEEGDRAPSDQSTTVPVLCLDRADKVGISMERPQAELDVGGTVRCQSRKGSHPIENEEQLLADGQWHKLVGDLRGCQAFEVVVGAGTPGSGHFALTHAIAVNAYNPTLGIFDFLNRRRAIRCTEACYGRRSDRIRLRWAGTSGRDAIYHLDVRSGSDFGENSRIRAHVTRLWFDPSMDRCSSP